MADKGAVGIDAGQMIVGGNNIGFPAISTVRVLSGEIHQVGITKDTSDGNPSQPSAKMLLPHRRSFLWPMTAGSHTISVDVKFTADSGTGFRPKMIIKANAELGISSDVTTEAAAGTGVWKTIGPITVTASAQGALEVILAYDPVVGETNIVHWDNVAVT